MIKSAFFYKELTAAEVGLTKTHEIYIRFPNYFDYESFFHHSAVEFADGIETTIEARNITNGYGSAPLEKLRFVFYSNGNKEKRMPSLGNLFQKNDVKEGDIVCLESREENGNTSYFIHFYKKGAMKLSPSAFYYTKEENRSNHASYHIDSRQIIYYGAPGTGKSHTVKEISKEAPKEFVFRTTFHPDSDYSTFVGAYKPTIYSVPEKFQSVKGSEKSITYSFVPQTFLQAYITAWQNPEKTIYLIIEEINRGNCAQIFGDLFQLLDRNDKGESEFPIKADRDISKYLKEEINLGEGINDDELKLPSNLYILATMNTSDQSLFPIDSAFKRRWDWKYIPIAKGKNQDGSEMNWTIGNTGIQWWSFLEKINSRIFETTNSEDKKLGFFFVQANNNVISIDTFLSKVIFYLWNDVYKDYGFDDDIFSIDEYKPIKFPDFFNADGSAKEDMVIKFIQKVCGINETDSPQQEAPIQNTGATE